MPILLKIAPVNLADPYMLLVFLPTDPQVMPLVLHRLLSPKSLSSLFSLLTQKLKHVYCILTSTITHLCHMQKKNMPTRNQ